MVFTCLSFGIVTIIACLSGKVKPKQEIVTVLYLDCILALQSRGRQYNLHAAFGEIFLLIN